MDSSSDERVFADFNNADEHGRVRLNTRGTARDLERLGISLCEGMPLILDDHDDVVAEAIVRWDGVNGWVAEVDWSAL